MNRSCDSTDSSNSSTGNDLAMAKSNYRILVLGAKRVGKTSIIRQFLYDKFSLSYKETVDDMYRGEFDIHGREISFDIQDISGSYDTEFPGMLNVSLSSADAFIIVFSLDSNDSWEEVDRFRNMIHEHKGLDVPIVVVANKIDVDLDPDIPYQSLEATVTFDWENGYVESSAKDGRNITNIFKEMLQQAKATYDLHPLPSHSSIIPQCPANAPPALLQSSKCHQKKKFKDNMKRRQSLPAVPAGILLEDCIGQEDTAQSSPSSSRKSSGVGASLANTLIGAGKGISRRSSLAVFRRESCKIS